MAPPRARRAGGTKAAPKAGGSCRQNSATCRRGQRGRQIHRGSNEAAGRDALRAEQRSRAAHTVARRQPTARLDSSWPARGDALEEDRPMLDGYIYNGLRTPFGRHAGGLAKLRPDDMLAAVVSEVVKQSQFDPEKIEDVVVGCANQAGEDSRCVARHAGLLAGLPIEVAGSVLQRNCGSGLNAIVMAAQAVTCGEGELM